MSKKKSKTKKQQREIDSNNNFIDRFFTSYNTIISIILLAIVIVARISWIHSQSPIVLEDLQADSAVVKRLQYISTQYAHL